MDVTRTPTRDATKSCSAVRPWLFTELAKDFFDNLAATGGDG